MAELEHQLGRERSKNEMLEHLGIAVKVPKLPEPLIPIETPRVTKKLQDYAWPSIKSDLQRQIQSITQDESISLSEARINVDADFAVPMHSLSKKQRRNPQEIAQETSGKLNQELKSDLIKSTRAESGYLNIELDTNPFANRTLGEIDEMGADYGKNNTGRGKTIVIDCSSPNIAKFMSVGHLRSTVIGESLARIYKANGYKVIRDNHLGDWGTQFGMLGRAHELWKDDIPELKTGKDTVSGLYQLYVKMHEEVEKEKEKNPDGESTLEQEGRAWFKRLEDGNPTALEMLHWSTTQSLSEFQRIYDLLGANFEYMLGESSYIPMIPDVVNSLLEKNVATQDSNGAVIVNFEEKDKLTRLVIAKSDGTSLYASRDLATLVARSQWFEPEKIMYVVGGDQTEYFKQVFKTFEKWTDGKGPKAEHIGFGMISLPEGKMSTRRGRVVFLEEVLTEAITREKNIIESGDRNLSPEEIDEVSKQVGVGAVIYFDLGQGRERNIKFDWDTALSMDGNSAPYIQYTYARTRAIDKKAKDTGITTNTDEDVDFELPTETALVKQLARFPEAVARAAEENKPSVIGEYTYKTADLFNQFYREAAIAVESDPKKRNSRLRLTSATGKVIKNGLNLLGIQSPEKM